MTSTIQHSVPEAAISARVTVSGASSSASGATNTPMSGLAQPA
ncbi:hypothetical protein FHS88_003503 [Roseomonas alkaliterrae]|uniref:Uncharacterized protein n=1 Tax=Neoroseomonas alkaliterrae TaxID=1452450 RepID=A0A840XW42_9PROT|nr:hypothetical protein [Neoroseomonas alkaliterrae]MBB5691350.1 hypothetical protein [Neoroseomonas alkaliterrae]